MYGCIAAMFTSCSSVFLDQTTLLVMTRLTLSLIDYILTVK